MGNKGQNNWITKKKERERNYIQEEKWRNREMEEGDRIGKGEREGRSGEGKRKDCNGRVKVGQGKGMGDRKRDKGEKK